MSLTKEQIEGYRTLCVAGIGEVCDLALEGLKHRSAISASVSPPDTEELHPIIVRLREHSPDDARIVQAWCNDLNRIGNENDDIREFLGEWDDSDTFIADSTLDIVMWAIKDLRAKAQPVAPQQEPVFTTADAEALCELAVAAVAKCNQCGAPVKVTKLPDGNGFIRYAAPKATVPEARTTGYYIACFEHPLCDEVKGRRLRSGYLLWWAPDGKGYTPDLENAGIYQDVSFLHRDGDVPVPVAFMDKYRIRRMVDVGDSVNAPISTAKKLRASVAAFGGGILPPVKPEKSGTLPAHQSQGEDASLDMNSVRLAPQQERKDG